MNYSHPPRFSGCCIFCWQLLTFNVQCQISLPNKMTKHATFLMQWIYHNIAKFLNYSNKFCLPFFSQARTNFSNPIYGSLLKKRGSEGQPGRAKQIYRPPSRTTPRDFLMTTTTNEKIAPSGGQNLSFRTIWVLCFDSRSKKKTYKTSLRSLFVKWLRRTILNSRNNAEIAPSKFKAHFKPLP